MLTKGSLVLAAVLLLFFAGNAKTEDTIPNELIEGVRERVASRHVELVAKVEAFKANRAVSAGTVDVSPSSRRMLELNSTIRTNIQKVSSRVSLISSDAWAISYTSFKTAKAAIVLLMGYMKASATGTITSDNLALLDFASNVASLNGELSDMLSRISKLNADAVSPLGLVKG